MTTKYNKKINLIIIFWLLIIPVLSSYYFGLHYWIEYDYYISYLSDKIDEDAIDAWINNIKLPSNLFDLNPNNSIWDTDGGDSFGLNKRNKYYSQNIKFFHHHPLDMTLFENRLKEIILYQNLK